MPRPRLQRAATVRQEKFQLPIAEQNFGLICPYALVNTGEREIVCKKEGEKKGSARGSVHWGCYYDTTLDIEDDPQRRRFVRREADFALQRLVECCALETERVR
jgi:hypothetical protein